jgi:uncharacterized glyoxalase superfamily protein PhnB
MDSPKIAAGQTIFPGLRYVDARAAIAWLQRAFGAEARAVYDDPNGIVAHAEIAIAGNVVMLGNTREGDDLENPVRSPRDVGGVTAGIYVALPDAAAVDALHARAAEAGATIRHAPFDTEYGSHEFRASDLEDHPWTFGTYKPGDAS